MSNDKHEDGENLLEEELEDAKRYFALKNWSQAADAYGQVLESLREKYEEEDPLFAPIFHRYGHALLEHAIATSGALGGTGAGKDSFGNGPQAKTVASARIKGPATDKTAVKAIEQATSSASASVSKASHNPRFIFGGDAEDSDEEEEEEAGGAGAVANGQEEEEEDDLSLAFSILELARIRYERILANGETGTMKTFEGQEWSSVMIKSQLAEVLNDLADVGLESENFQQASADYQTALEMLTPLLQPHSRRLADAYLRLGLALEFHPDASLQALAEKYVTAACTTLEKRLESLKARQRVLEKERQTEQEGLAKAEAAANDVRMEKAEIESTERLVEEGIISQDDQKLKGKEEEKQPSTKEIFEKDDVAGMHWEQVEKEQKDILEMIQELRLKLEEYANAAPGTNDATSGSSLLGGSSKEKLQQAINEALLGSSTNALGAPKSDPNAPVNDLSAMVKKKRKPPVAEEDSKENGKRKQQSSLVEVASESDSSKKVKVD